MSWYKLLLSHHYPKDYNHCLVIKIRKKNVYLCARCSGIFLASSIFLVINFMIPSFPSYLDLIILYSFPIPAFLNWAMESFDIFDSGNKARVFTGFMLGITFSRIAYYVITNIFYVHIWIISMICLSFVFIISVISKRAAS